VYFDLALETYHGILYSVTDYAPHGEIIHQSFQCKVGPSPLIIFFKLSAAVLNSSDQ
jgi:hypothetical protein